MANGRKRGAFLTVMAVLFRFLEPACSHTAVPPPCHPGYAVSVPSPMHRRWCRAEWMRRLTVDRAARDVPELQRQEGTR
jgi:hypothetical protein